MVYRDAGQKPCMRNAMGGRFTLKRAGTPKLLYESPVEAFWRSRLAKVTFH